MLFCQDKKKRTFLHWAVCEHNWPEITKNIITTLPKRIIQELSVVRDVYKKTVNECATDPVIRGYLEEVGVTDTYHLQIKPKVLIFYSTKNRQTSARVNDAWEEKECVRKYFSERGFPCTEKRNPTAEEIFEEISAATEDESSLSGLIVFMMSHGGKGLVAVEGDTGPLSIHEVIAHLCLRTVYKPKVK